MSPADLAFHDEVFRFLGSLGAAVTRTDLAVAGSPTACAAGPRSRCARRSSASRSCALRPPYGEFATDTALGGWTRPPRSRVALDGSSDAATARTAAAVVAILGRSAVTGVEATPDDGTASAPALLPHLAAQSPVVRFAGFMLIGVGAPHDAATLATAVLDAAAADRPEAPAERGQASFSPRPRRSG